MKAITIIILLACVATVGVGFFLFGKQTKAEQETMWKGEKEVYGSAVAIDPLWKVHAIWQRTNPFADHVGPFEYTFRWPTQPTAEDVTASIPPPLVGKWKCVRLTYIQRITPLPETPQKNEELIVQ